MKVWFEDMYFPKCFDSQEQFAEWHKSMLQSKAPVYTSWVCVDCLPAYQKKMKKEGRCENPHVRFKKEYEVRPNGEIRDSDWYIVGYVSEAAYQKELKKRKVERKKFWMKLQNS